ncbi:3-methylfumaryl-CoA hydratase [Rhizobiaceae bacterium]|nr:3-methylfumaryl-CoA hydratase [Rhizobiaceae bacterium]
MTEVDIARLRRWIGREERKTDVVTVGLADRFRATLGGRAVAPGEALPLAIHWCLAPAAVPPEEIGSDGHPARGGFLPPVPLPRRMWAGGALEFLLPLQVGDTVERLSRIADVSEKVGRTGRLVFVTVEHEISTDAGLAVSERQDLVYREAQAASVSPAAPGAPRPADASLAVDATTTLLFRYSALTFNGHRIHYDRDYARSVEGYPGLVVHGPLQATLLANLAARLADGRPPRRFVYRGVSPLFDGAPFTANAVRRDGGFDLWCADSRGAATMTATAES